MKRLFLASSIGVLAVILLVLVQSCGVLGGAPRDVQVAADTIGTNVMVGWTPPAEGTPDSYLVSFMALQESTYVLIAETTSTSCVHDPQGFTGTYKVVAKFGEDVYEAADKPTTVPVYTDTVAVAELDASGNSGYGWDRESGAGRTYSMIEAGNAVLADFYITDFTTGSSRLPYAIASPNMGPSDLGGPVPPSEDWRVNGFTDPLTSENDPLPSQSPTVYFNWTDITQTPMIVGCHTEDGHYVMVKIDNVNSGAGEVRLISWFQLVSGLRLIMHESE